MTLKKKFVGLFHREKLSATEIKKSAINAGLKAVRECWPETRLTIGDIMMMDLNTKSNKKTNNIKSSKYFPHALSKNCGPLNKGQVLLVFKKAANDYCKKNGIEPLF